MTFIESDYMEAILLSGVLAKHLKLAFKDSFYGQKLIHSAPKKGKHDFPMVAVSQSWDTVNHCCDACLQLEACYLQWEQFTSISGSPIHFFFFANLESTCYLLPQAICLSFPKAAPVPKNDQFFQKLKLVLLKIVFSYPITFTMGYKFWLAQLESTTT